ncbi:MAG: hypothetical protein LBM96_01455 [Methanobrevibacter sp.]|nr:hypothetical protein [Candidatus Methanoflexus mossambicus]
MASTIKSLVGGFILIFMGAIIFVQSRIYHFKDIFILLGVGLVGIGLIVIFSGYLSKSNLKISKPFKNDLTNKNSNIHSNKQNNLLSPHKNNNFNHNPNIVSNHNLNSNLKSNSNSSKHTLRFNPSKIKNIAKGIEFNKSKFPNNEPLESHGYLGRNRSSSSQESIFKLPEDKYFKDKELPLQPHYNRPVPIIRRPSKRKTSLPEVDKSQVHKKLKTLQTNNNNISDGLNKNVVNDTESKNENILKKLQSNENKESIGNLTEFTPEKLDFNAEESFVFCENKVLSSFEAFDYIAGHANNELLIETNSLKYMSEKFLSFLSSLDVKILVQSFDFKDMSYIILLSSLIEQGAEIRILSVVNTTNIIADNNYALIISKNKTIGDLDVGALYMDNKSISNIKKSFKKSWESAKVLEINLA